MRPNRAVSLYSSNRPILCRGRCWIGLKSSPSRLLRPDFLHNDPLFSKVFCVLDPPESQSAASDCRQGPSTRKFKAALGIYTAHCFVAINQCRESGPARRCPFARGNARICVGLLSAWSVEGPCSFQGLGPRRIASVFPWAKCRSSGLL